MVLSAVTATGLPESVLRLAAQACVGGGGRSDRITADTRTLLTSAIPFPDIGKRPVGCLYLVIDLTKQRAGDLRFLSALTALGAGIGLLMFAVFYFILARVRSRLVFVEQDRAALRKMASRDALTGLYNRRHLSDMLEHELLACRSQERPLSLLMVDLDHFKRINDSFGHPCGDKMLVAVGQAVLDELRDTDRAVRYGGEEFLILLPGSSVMAAMEVGERLRAGIGALAIPCSEQARASVTASIGVASFPDDAQTADTLLKLADDALYVAKSLGRDRVGRPRMAGDPPHAGSPRDRGKGLQAASRRR